MEKDFRTLRFRSAGGEERSVNAAPPKAAGLIVAANEGERIGLGPGDEFRQ
jgi:hypothetical protein